MVQKWGYDAGFMYHVMSVKGTLKTAALAATTNEAGIYARVKGATDRFFSFGCHITIASATTYTGVWGFYVINDTVGAISGATVAWSAQTNTAAGAATASDASTATVFGTAISLAADKANAPATIMAGSTMNIAADRGTFECMTKVKYV